MTPEYVSMLQAATINPCISVGLNSNCLNTASSCSPFFSEGSCTVPLQPQAAQPGLLQTLPSHTPSRTWSSSICTCLSAANTKLTMMSTTFQLLMRCSSYYSWIVQYLSLLRAWDFGFVCLQLKNCSARGSKIGTEKTTTLQHISGPEQTPFFTG